MSLSLYVWLQPVLACCFLYFITCLSFSIRHVMSLAKFFINFYFRLISFFYSFSLHLSNWFFSSFLSCSLSLFSPFLLYLLSMFFFSHLFFSSSSQFCPFSLLLSSAIIFFLGIMWNFAWIILCDMVQNYILHGTFNANHITKHFTLFFYINTTFPMILLWKHNGPDFDLTLVLHWCNTKGFSGLLLIHTGVNQGRIRPNENRRFHCDNFATRQPFPPITR